MADKGTVIGMEYSGIADGITRDINTLKELEAQTKKTGESVQKMNEQMASGATNSQKAIGQQMRATVEAKKAADERAKVEKILNKTIEEKAKLDINAADAQDKATVAAKENTKATQS